MNQTELLDQFIQEARECLEQVGQRLLEVEKSPTDAELLNDLFRLVHTLKGNCGLFEFKPLERVVHAGEDLLDRVRNGTLAYNDHIADALLEAMDFTVQMVDEIEQTSQIDSQADGRSSAVAARLRTLLQNGGKLPGTPAPAQAAATAANIVACAAAPETTPAAVAPAWLATALSAELIKAHPNAVAWRYRPDAECFFKGEDPWLLAKQAPAILHLSIGSQSEWPSAAEIDCYQCMLELIGLSDAPVAYVNEHFRCMPEQLEVVELSLLAPAKPDAGTAAPQAPAKPPAHATMRKRALQLWDDQMALLARPGLATGTLSAVRMALRGLLMAIGDEPALRTAAELQTLPGTASAVAVVTWATLHRPVEHAEGDTTACAAMPTGSAADLDPVLNSPYPAYLGASGAAGTGGPDASRRNGAPANNEESGHQKVLKVGQ
jgi:two-component system chemotaxis sensor kinase CheA